jgi:hypothetical protein
MDKSVLMEKLVVLCQQESGSMVIGGLEKLRSGTLAGSPSKTSPLVESALLV